MTDPSNPSLEVARKRFAEVEAQLNDIYLEISMIEQRRARLLLTRERLYLRIQALEEGPAEQAVAKTVPG
jgi:hypothetical protein